VKSLIRLSIPDLGEEELEEIREVLETGYLVQGEKVAELEDMVANYLKVKHVIAVSSGTAALHLALLALGIGKGDQVIVPDFTFPATANVVELTGATSKFVDIRLDNYCIDVTKIEKYINSKTRVIIPVHEFGQAADMKPILALAKKYNLHVIEDAACALGTEYMKKKVGTLGTIGCFSLHPRKAITTGEGGLIATNDSMLAEKIRVLRNHGLSYVESKPKFVLLGLNYRLTNIQGAIGVVQFRRLNDILRKRKQIAQKYTSKLSNSVFYKTPTEKVYGSHIFQTYHILVDQKVNRDKLIKVLKDRGIETNFGAYAVHIQPYYQYKYKLKDNLYKNSLIAFNQGLALPMHSKLTDTEIDEIVAELEKAAKS
jgi:perosamine synthetase